MRVFSAAADALRSCLGGAVDLLLPRTCAACAAADVAADGLCEKCNLHLLSLVSLPYCPRCGATVGPYIPVREDGCAGCPDTQFRFVRVIRLGPYADPLRGVIRGLKYRRDESMRRRLGRLLARAVETGADFPPIDLVVPVPMHWRRRFARGYDHARVLAGAVARELRIPLGDELVRLRHTVAQYHLPRSRRIENVRGAFGVTSRAGVQAAHILLIDDVTTTGATANEAARTLRSAGASRVTLAVVAKSEPPTAYTQHLA